MKIDVSYSPEEILEYSQRPTIFSTLSSYSRDEYRNLDSEKDNFAIGGHDQFDGDSHVDCEVHTGVSLSKYDNDGNRKIGLITGVHDDGSFNLAILGNGSFLRSTEQSCMTLLHVWCSYPFNYLSLYSSWIEVDDTTDPAQYHSGQDGNVKYFSAERWKGNNSGNYRFENISQSQAISYTPTWITPNDDEDSVGETLHFFGKLAGQPLDADMYSWALNDIQLTTNKATTLTIGDMYRQYTFSPVRDTPINNGFKNIGGALYDILLDKVLECDARRIGHKYNCVNGFPPEEIEIPLVFSETGTYAQHYLPFNLILTRNESEAMQFISTGKLPSDAFIYPYDPNNIQTNTSGTDPGDEWNPDSTDTPGEDGTPSDNADDMPTDEPSFSPQSLCNNNLYWLSALGLQQFIDWFWTDATDIASLGDLWDKIIGLYENLSQAILSIRYMPVDKSWIGGTSTDTKIIVGMIEKTHAVETINKSVSGIRPIGTFDIKELFNGSWCNFTPYSSMSLYLPFHGMVQLDNDLLMGHKICVEAIYDCMSGTIQYFVHRDTYSGSLIYSTVAKMSVEIPITLQTKTERDSAIFQNVSNLTAGLIGAGASAVGGSPVGMTMGLANLASYQPASAGMHVIGSVGESGAFYAPKKCAIYIKRPAYNRPSSYKSHVGFPANTTQILSKCSGFTTCYNPRITFTGNTHTEGSDSVVIKPTKSEVERIYEMLEKGVII